MAGLKSWLANELAAIGWAGLESVHEYLETLSAEDVRAHLQGLLGEEEPSRNVIDGYIQKRQQVDNGAGPSSAPQESSVLGGKKNRRARGKAKKMAGQGGQLKKNTGPHIRSSSLRSDAEAIRQKVYGYRSRRAPLNCLSCGFIELIVPEDGFCSNCGDALFSVDDRDYDAELKGFEGLSVQDLDENGNATDLKSVVDLKAIGEDINASFVYPERPYLNSTLPGGTKNMPKVRAEHMKQLSELVVSDKQKGSSMILFEVQ